MKNSTIKVWSIVLAALISLGGVGTAVFALKGSESEESAAQQESAVVEATDAAAGPTKDETVYVLAGADGAVKKIIVGDWLQNPLGSDSLDDVSELSDIENVKNDAQGRRREGLGCGKERRLLPRQHRKRTPGLALGQLQARLKERNAR